MISVSVDGRVIMWSAKQKRQLAYFNLESELICADINSKNNVLAVGTSDGIIQFYNISNFDNAFVFKEFRLTRGKAIDQVTFSTNGEQLAVLSKN